ncbi:hypothetical protein cypCar_00012167, partial [Cyprinus carpio]
NPCEQTAKKGFSSFQRTPSLRRKWRKRYGGLDGNKLLEPNKEDDTRDSAKEDFSHPGFYSLPPTHSENGEMTDALTNRSADSVKFTASKETKAAGNIPQPVPRNTFPSQRPVNYVSPGSTGMPSFISNGGTKRTVPEQDKLHASQAWQHLGRPETHQGHFKKKVAADVLFDSFASGGRVNCNQFFEEKEDVRESATKWGISVCTVDGQRLSLGDWAEPCILGEISWPLIYGLAVDQQGSDYVHRFVGMEEYCKYESPFTLTKQGVPHSPLVETGAIICTSLLQLATRPVTDEEEKYESVLNIIRRLCNKEHANLNCTSYQNLRKDIIHLHALSFYLQEKKCFPEGVGINSTLDLLLQCLSTEVTCESGAALAATLANGGLCPLSGDQVMSPHAVRSTLSMMQVAGMNDYSRMFHFKTSVPAKSSQSGAVLIVVPGVLGLMCWSPGLDCNGNSWRGVHFCEELVSTFQLHSFDIRTPFRQVLCYRQWKVESEGYQIMNVLLAAYRGDIVSLRRYLLSGADVNAVDYDGRSALHVAASEGRLDVIKFLVENAGANCRLKDRWGNTALQEAMRCNQDPAIQFLKKYIDYEESL